MFSIYNSFITLFGDKSTRCLRALVPACAALWLTACETSTTGPTDTSKTTQAMTPAASPKEFSELDNHRYTEALGILDDGNAEEALKSLKALAKRYPGNLNLKVNLATAYYMMGELKAAKTTLENGDDTLERSPDVFNVRGLIAVEHRDFKHAESQYLKALALDSKHAEAHYNLALLYDIYYQDIERAYRHYLEYLKIVPGDQTTKDWIEQLRYSLDRG